jgi:hypothetical protein
MLASHASAKRELVELLCFAAIVFRSKPGLHPRLNVEAFVFFSLSGRSVPSARRLQGCVLPSLLHAHGICCGGGCGAMVVILQSPQMGPGPATVRGPGSGSEAQPRRESLPHSRSQHHDHRKSVSGNRERRQSQLATSVRLVQVMPAQADFASPGEPQAPRPFI